MTRYGYPTPAPEHTIVWDRNMTAWHRDNGDQWTQITDRTLPAHETWETLFTALGPLETAQREAAHDRFQTGETYRIRYAATGETPPENIPDAIANGEIGVYEAVYSLDNPVQFTLTPPEDAAIDAPVIEGIHLMEGSIFILETERLISIPQRIFRMLIAGTPSAAAEAATWYKTMYGKATNK
jgi:hypothetical protein|nr:MAG TPA: hypothetical protein [Caudoviricetes sp.]